MDANDWTIREKPYDLRERLFNFACVITRVTQFPHTRGPIAVALCAGFEERDVSRCQLREADDGSSQKDVRAKRQIVLRELKETSFRLRVLRKTGMLTPEDPVMIECDELAKIVAALVRKSKPA